MSTLLRSTTVFLLSVMLAGAVAAQTVEVQNGGTVQVQNSGVWHLKGGTMDFGLTGSTATLDEKTAGRVTGGQLTAVRVLNAPNAGDPAGLGAVITASVDLGAVTLTRGHTVQTASNGNVSIERFYDISPSQNNSGLSATLTYTYHDAELGGLSESALELFKSDNGGSTWTEKGVDSRDAQFNTVTLSGIESFSRWTLGSEASPLPVEIAQFGGTKTGSDAVMLRWTTASETNNAGFRVQRKTGIVKPSRDGSTPHSSASARSWQTVGFIDGAGTTTELQTYRFEDVDLPYAADRVTYRLKQVDTDGTTSLSDEVTIERTAVSELQLLAPYPNPARTRATVRYAIPEEETASDVTLRLYDVLGRAMRTVSSTAAPGRHAIRLDTDRLTNGVYFLRLVVGDVAKTQRLTVAR